MSVMVDILIRHAEIITMDERRTVIKDGAVSVADGRIVRVGRDEELRTTSADRTIDLSGHAVLPGLIDTHGHAGHGLIKTLAENRDDWNELVFELYTKYTDSSFWRAEAELSALERLKFGVTTGVSFFGGGAGAFRVARPEFATEYAQAVDKVGIRGFLGVGPSGRFPPFEEVEYSDGESNTTLNFDSQLANAEEAISAVNSNEGNQHAILAVNTVAPKDKPSSEAKLEMKEQVAKLLEVRERSGLKMISHATGGSIQLAKEIGILGPHLSMAHCAGLSQEEVAIIAETRSGVVHCPRARSIMKSRCPVPELLDSGVLVTIGTDGNSPDRTFDLFQDMRSAMSLQRTFFHTSHIMPPGKMLEMVTVDAAKQIGLEEELGSLEPGKRADIISVNLRKAHLAPLVDMVPQRMIYEASGSDVDFVIVGGKVRVEEGVPAGIDEEGVVERAEDSARRVISKAGYEKYLEMPKNFWGGTRY